jgi:hypothetical protein
VVSKNRKPAPSNMYQKWRIPEAHASSSRSNAESRRGHQCCEYNYLMLYTRQTFRQDWLLTDPGIFPGFSTSPFPDYLSATQFIILTQVQDMYTGLDMYYTQRQDIYTCLDMYYTQRQDMYTGLDMYYTQRQDMYTGVHYAPWCRTCSRMCKTGTQICGACSQCQDV